MGMEIVADRRTRVSWIPLSGDPIDLSDGPVTVPIQLVPEPDPFAEVVELGWFKPVRFTSRLRMTPAGYRVLLGRTHPRIRRMHAAYGRRRKGW